MNPWWRIHQIVTDQEVVTSMSPSNLMAWLWYRMIEKAKRQGYVPLEFKKVDEPHLARTVLVIELWPDWDT